MEITKIFHIKPNSKALHSEVPIPAGEAIEIQSDFEEINLNEFLTGQDDYVLLVRATGDSMESEIEAGDYLIINQDIEARNGDRVLAYIGGRYTIKIFRRTDKSLRLVASNGKYVSHPVSSKDNFKIFGVVTHVLKNLRRTFHR